MPEQFATPEPAQADGGGVFPVTLWSTIVCAKGGDAAALARLVERYYQPLVRYARLKGEPDAQDVVHDFIARKYTATWLLNVAEEKGRFRTWLKRCLDNFLNDRRDKRTVEKPPGGGQVHQPLEAESREGEPAFQLASKEASPDLEFDRTWAKTVLDNALLQVETECRAQDRAALFAEVEPVLFLDDTASPYRTIAARLDMTEGAVKMAILRIRKRLGALIREEICQTVGTAEDLESELRYLIGLFGK